MNFNIVFLQVQTTRLLFINWLQHHLIPCPFKYITGIDCPLCGFQRAVLALGQGQYRQSFLLYPPAIPILLFAGYLVARIFFKLDNAGGNYKRRAFIVVCVIVLVSYGMKMWSLYHH